ncbi:uncharacterized protein [Equus przewalskii]|uniref:Uncharacterized protein isoform X5 n=1 Tax=Equus przewalskii TaxID=9798 RepID=A0ABM4JG97_EQUPR
MHVCICANGKKYTSRILKRTDIKLRWSVHDGPCVSPGAERPTSSHAPLGRHRTTDSISQDAIHPVPGRLQSRGAQSPLGGEVPGRPRASWRKRGPKCLWLLCIGGGRASGGALWLCEQTAAKDFLIPNQTRSPSWSSGKTPGLWREMPREVQGKKVQCTTNRKEWTQSLGPEPYGCFQTKALFLRGR